MTYLNIDGRRLTESERLTYLASHRQEDELLADEWHDPIYWTPPAGEVDGIREYPPPVENMQPVDYEPPADPEPAQESTWLAAAAFLAVMAVIIAGFLYFET